MLLVAVGSAHAGIDLTRVKDSDVRINGTSLELTLPRAEILTSALSLNDSHIYDTQRRWLLSEYEGLEKEALDRAERELEEGVQRNEGMMRLAEEFAQLSLAEFLRNLGFTEVTITFK